MKLARKLSNPCLRTHLRWPQNSQKGKRKKPIFRKNLKNSHNKFLKKDLRCWKKLIEKNRYLIYLGYNFGVGLF